MAQRTNGRARQARLNLLRSDVRRSLRRRGIDPSSLNALQRILLTTDGSVTGVLEAYFGQPMRMVKLHQASVTLRAPHALLELARGQRVVHRTILLQGRESRKTFLYAESVVVASRLHPAMRDALMKSVKPFGQLIIENRVETFREILDCGREPSGPLAETFGMSPGSTVIFRTYRIFARGRPIILITERLPEQR